MLKLLTVLLVALLYAAPAHATYYDYADWISGQTGSGTATPPGFVTGKIGSVFGGMTIRVDAFSVLPSQAGAPGETVYWRDTPTYKSATVDNAPVTADIVKISAAQAYTITFGVPVTDPIIPIVSIGGTLATSWDFGANPIRILSQGPGAFGSGTMSVDGNILTGKEAHGTIQVIGTYTSITFTMTVFENWTGFTVGIPGIAPPPVAVPKITSLLPNPFPLVHPFTGNLTVTINPVQTTATIIPLTNSGTAVVQVPTVVMVPANQTTGSISITTLSQGSATVTATINSPSISSTANSVITVTLPPPPPPPITYGTISLSWDLVPVTDEAPIDVNRIYRGADQECDMNDVPLAAWIGSTTYPVTGFTDTKVPMNVNRVCWAVTSVNLVGESLQSNRAFSTVGSLVPGVPKNLHIVIP